MVCLTSDPLVEIQILTDVIIRDHVMEYWPNPGTKSSQVRSMYRRLKGIPEDEEERRVKAQDEAEKARREIQSTPSTTNGQVNGASV